MIIRPEAEVEGKRTSDVVKQLLASVPVLASPSICTSARGNGSPVVALRTTPVTVTRVGPDAAWSDCWAWT